MVATQKDENLVGYKLMVVQPLGLDMLPVGTSFVAIDQVDAGEGDRVLVAKEGSSARLILGRERVPVQAVIVGVVDGVDVAQEYGGDS